MNLSYLIRFNAASHPINKFSMKVIATICSLKKSSDPGKLSAKDRYLGDHIKFARAVTVQTGTPLYILLGKFGLVSGDDVIPDYDYLLKKSSDRLVKMVAAQAQAAKITEIDFYSKDKDSWAPYTEVLHRACKFGSITLKIHAI